MPRIVTDVTTVHPDSQAADTHATRTARLQAVLEAAGCPSFLAKETAATVGPAVWDGVAIVLATEPDLATAMPVQQWGVQQMVADADDSTELVPHVAESKTEAEATALAAELRASYPFPDEITLVNRTIVVGSWHAASPRPQGWGQ